MDKTHSSRMKFGIASSIMALPIAWIYGEIAGRPSESVSDLLMLLSLLCMLNISSFTRDHTNNQTKEGVNWNNLLNSRTPEIPAYIGGVVWIG